MTSHALLSPSGASRWLHCTPSARLEATLPEPKRRPGTKDFSGEGTLAHSLSEAKLRFQLDQIGSEEYDKEIELIKQNPLYSQELEEVSNIYVNYVRSQAGSEDHIFIEAKVDLGEYVVESFGTADCIIISKNKITVIDLKAGAGVPVSAINNEQLRLYALGAYERYKAEFPEIKEVRTIIVQPRLDSITEDHTTIAKLIEWGRYYVKPRAQKAYLGTGEFIPSEKGCSWCRAKAQCKAREEYNTALAKLEFREAALLSDEEIDLVLTKAKQLKSWASDIEDYILDRAVDQGILPTGYKLGTTLTHRKIADPELAAVVLKEKGFADEVLWEPRKMKSLASLEKVNKNVTAMLGDLVIRPAGSPKLIKDTSVQEDFK